MLLFISQKKQYFIFRVCGCLICKAIALRQRPDRKPLQGAQRVLKVQGTKVYPRNVRIYHVLNQLGKHLKLVIIQESVPAYLNLVAKIHGVIWSCSCLKIADIKRGQCMVHEAMHGAILTVHIQVHEAWNEVGCE